MDTATAREQEAREERERRAALLELWQWAPRVQAQLTKLERFTNRLAGEFDSRLDRLEARAEALTSETRKLRYQLEVAARERKDLREELKTLRMDLVRPQRPPPPPAPRCRRLPAARSPTPPLPAIPIPETSSDEDFDPVPVTLV